MDTQLNSFCSYNKVNYDTLEPDDIISQTRLEVLLSNIDIENKNFLDIGFNSGLLPLQLFKKGAKTITALDLQKQHIDKLQTIIDEYKITNISIKNLDFMQLSDNCNFDIVYFLEVLHWSIYQKNKISDVIYKLYKLTNEILFIEFPWDCTEPSIKKMTNLTEKEYNSYEIIKELHKYFEKVSILYFPNYFKDSNSKRILIQCKNKRLIQEFKSTNFCFSGYEIIKKGTKKDPILTIVESNHNYYILKKIDKFSYLYKTNTDDGNNYLNLINKLEDSIIVKPLPFYDNIFLYEINKEKYYISEYIHNTKNIDRDSVSINELSMICYRLLNDLSKFDKNFIDNFIYLYDYSWMKHTDKEIIANITKITKRDILSIKTNKNLFNIYFNKILNFNEIKFDCISHSDLNLSNLIYNEKINYKIVDLEGPQPATIYFDGLFAFILYGAEMDDYKKHIEFISSKHFRSFDTNDMVVTMIYSIGWLNYILTTQQNTILREDGITHFEIGFKNFILFCSHYFNLRDNNIETL